MFRNPCFKLQIPIEFKWFSILFGFSYGFPTLHSDAMQHTHFSILLGLDYLNIQIQEILQYQNEFCFFFCHLDTGESM